LAQGFYLKTSSGWKTVKKFFVKTSSGWKPIKYGYVKTALYGWKQFFSTNTTYPVNTVSPSISAASYATTTISGEQALLGTTLTGNKGTWTSTNGSISYSYLWFADGVTTGNTTTTFNTSNYDGQFITFQVTATNLVGSTIATSSQLEVTKNAPVYIDYSLSTTSPKVGDLLSITSHWTTTANTIPDYYTATFSSGSGVVTYDSRQTSSWFQYYVSNTDIGSPISAYVTAYNTGSPDGSSTPTLFTNSVSYAVPANISQPYFSYLSGTPNRIGSTYRLNFGTWLNNPSSYGFQIYKNDQAGTNIYPPSGYANSTNTYYDITFNQSTNPYTVGAFVYATNNGGNSNVVGSSNTIGPILPNGTAPTTVTVSGDNALAIGGTFTWSADGTPTPTYRFVIGYNATNGSGPFSTKYDSTGGATLTTSNGVTTTSWRPYYDGGWAGAGYYRCTVFAINAFGGPVYGSNTTYMN